MNRTPDLHRMGFDGYGATRETRGTSQNVKSPRTVSAAGGMTGSRKEAPDEHGCYAHHALPSIRRERRPALRGDLGATLSTGIYDLPLAHAVRGAA